MSRFQAPRPKDRSRLHDLGDAGGRMYVCDRGPIDAPTLVLLHGLLVHHYEFRHLIPRFAGDYRVIAPDLPGCGNSDHRPPEACSGYTVEFMAQAVCSLLDRLDLRGPLHLLGHSFGGAIAGLIARERGDSLCLLDSSCFDMELPLEGKLAMLPKVGPLVFTRVFGRSDLRRYFNRVFADPRQIDELAIDIYWDRLARPGAREAAYAMMIQLPDLRDVTARFRDIRCPTAVVWGERDELIPVEHGERLAALIAGSSFQTIAGCGHAPNEEAPGSLAAVLEEHLANLG